MTTTTTINDNNTGTVSPIETTTTNAVINLNNSTGNDSITTDGSGSATISANNSTGNDTIDIENATSATVSLNNSTGSDDVDIEDMTGAVSATVNLNNAMGKDDDVTIAAATVNATVNLNNSGLAGYIDDVSITGGNVTAAVNLNNSGGNDAITIQGSSSTNATVNLNNSGGNDVVYIGSATSTTTATVNLNGSGGTDIIDIMGLSTTATVNLVNSTGRGDVVKLVGKGTGTINATNSTGNDTLIGANSTDTITGGIGNDTVELEGAGTINAGAGNDLGIYTLSDHYALGVAGLKSSNGDVDAYYGQGGINTLELVFTTDQWNYQGVQSDLKNYANFLASNPGPNQTFTFHFGAASGALTVAGWQNLDIHIGGAGNVLLDPIGVEGTPIPLGLTATIASFPGTSLSSLVIGAIPVGAVLSDGMGHSFQATAANTSVDVAGWNVANLTITPANDTNFTLSIAATKTDGVGSITTTASEAVTVDPLAPAVSPVAAAGKEDSAIALNLGVTVSGEPGEVNTRTSLVVGAIPVGATLSDGTNSFTATAGQTSVDVNSWNLAKLTITPPLEFDGSINLSVAATEKDAEGDSSATTTAVEVITVNEKADAPTLSVTNTTTVEDSAVALSINASAAELDQNAPSITITGRNGGSLNHGTNNNGTWTLTQADLTGLTFTPAAETGGTVNLTVTAIDTEAGVGNTASSAPKTLTVTVNEKADAPTLTVTNATTVEDTAVALSITAIAAEGDQNAPTVTISGLNGGTLNHGTNNNGTWTLTQADLSGLTFTPASELEGTVNLIVTAIDTEAGTGNVASSAPQTLAVTVKPSPDTPTPGSVTTNPTPLSFKGNQTDSFSITFTPNFENDADAVDKITISGIPSSNNNGTITVTDNFAGDTWSAVSFSGNPSTGTSSVTTTDTTSPLTVTFTNTKNWTTGSFTLHISESATEGGITATSSTVNVSGTITPAGVAGQPINLGLTDLSSGQAQQVSLTISGVPIGWMLNQGQDLGNGTWAVQTNDLSSLAVTTLADFAGAAMLNVTENWTNADGGTEIAYVPDNVEAYAPGSPIFAVSGDDNLTGDGGNDEFVFAQPIGNDTVFGFNAATDQIDLIGFANAASFGDIQANIADDANGNAVITLGASESITLKGIDAAALSASNFVFNAEPVTVNTGTMTVRDGAILPLGGTIDNTGTIALGATGDETDLEVLVRGVTLQGGGQVTLSDDSANVIFGGDASAVLTNIDNTIAGAGQLGDGELTLVNDATILANGANALVIDTGAASITNAGTLEATGAGGLVVKSAVANTGTLAADGGNVSIAGAVSGGGNASIAGSATLDFGAAADANVAFAAGAAGTLELDQSGAFSGAVSGFAAGDAIDLADIAFGSTAILGYTANQDGSGGTLTVSDGVHTTSIALLGQYAAAGFQVAADQGGGTMVTYTDPMQSQQAVLTQPQH